jgi:hypothetical protein
MSFPQTLLSHDSHFDASCTEIVGTIALRRRRNALGKSAGIWKFEVLLDSALSAS